MLKKDIKTIATNSELKPELKKLKKKTYQTHDLSLFIGQTFFGNDGRWNSKLFSISTTY